MMASPTRSLSPDSSLVLPPFQPSSSSSRHPHTSPTHPHPHPRPHSRSSFMPPTSTLAASASASRLPPALTGHDLMDAFPNPPPPVPDEYGRARFNQSERAFLSSRAGERTRDHLPPASTSTSASTSTRDRSRSDAVASFIRLPPLVKSGEREATRDPSLGRLRASPFAPSYLGGALPPPPQPPFSRSQTPQPYHNNYTRSSWSRDPSDPTPQLHHPYTHHHHHQHHHPSPLSASAGPPTNSALHRPKHHHSRSASDRSSFESTGALRNPPPPPPHPASPASAGSGTPQYSRSQASNSPPVSRPTTSSTISTALGLPPGTVLPKPPSTVGTARPPSASNTTSPALGPVRTPKRQRTSTRGNNNNNDDDPNRVFNSVS